MKLTSAPTARRAPRKLRRAGAAKARQKNHRPPRLEPLEERILLAADLRLISILQPDGDPLSDGAKLSVAPSELTFLFNEGQSIDPSSLGGIQLTASGSDGVFGDPNDASIVPGFVGLTSQPNEVVMRFAERLVDDVYQILIAGTGATPLMNTLGEAFNDGADVTQAFELDLGAQVIAAVPQPVARNAGGNLEQNDSQIVVYFNDDNLNLASAQNPAFYQLIDTQGTVDPLDDVLSNPLSVTYDSGSDTAVLEFGGPLAAATYRLRIGNNDSLPVAPLATAVAADAGGVETHSSFDTAFNLGTLGPAARVVSSSIDPQAFGPALPGAINEPGHRDIQVSVPGESHLNAGADSAAGITTASYNFQDIYGTDPQGNVLHNVITEAQKQRAREIFSLYGHFLGIEFVETASSGITVVTGDLRAVSPTVPTGPGGVAGISEGSLFGRVIMDAAENWGASEYGGGWFQVALHEIGHSLGLGHTLDLPALTLLGDFGTGEPVFPGDNDIVHGQFRFRPESKDIDLYRFEVPQSGLLSAETIAERLSERPGTNASLLNSVLTLYEEIQVLEVPSDGGFGLADGHTFQINDGANVATFEFDLGDGVSPGNVAITFSRSDAASRLARNIFAIVTGADAGLNLRATVVGRSIELHGFVQVANNSALDLSVGRSIVARNDDYFSNDSLVRLPVEAGIYFVAVTSTGNTNFDPTIRDSGFGGTTQGPYELQLSLQADPSASLVDAAGTLLDGDADGTPGGTFNFWFQVGNTLFVDRANDADPNAAEGDGSLADPYDTISSALAAAQPGDLVRIVGNGGADGDLGTVGDNLPYLVGIDDLGRNLRDGREMLVPQDVTVMIDAGAILKLRRANIDVGTSAQENNRSQGALQLLGTPDHQVLVTSYRNDAIGGDSDGLGTGPFGGDWGGLVYRDDSDREDAGIFLNFVSNADLSFGGGEVLVNSVRRIFSPIHLVAARPTILQNTITNTGQNADAAISADPISFEETRFTGYDRVGPDIDGNVFLNNSVNGVFVRILTPFNSAVLKLEVSARFDDTDAVHVVTENLFIAGTPGGPEVIGGLREARLDGRLAIDPGIIVKMLGARIEVEIGAQLIAEGRPGRDIIITSLRDDSYGAGGTFDTNRDGAATTPAAEDWGGMFFWATSKGSLDYAEIAYAGGITPIEGGFEQFGTIEIHQADVRIANSEIRNAGNGAFSPGQSPGLGNRNGRGTNAAAVIFVRGAQPAIVGNTFRDNDAATIHINANALNTQRVVDLGRSTGALDHFTVFGDDLRSTGDNQGPLVRFNRIDNDPRLVNGLNGMLVRGAVLTTESVWDDTDVVHIVLDEIIVPNHHTFGGLRLQSKTDESLVVKLFGDDAGFTAAGNEQEIDDRIGGTVEVLGQPDFPVVLTSLFDCTQGAGLLPDGNPHVDTANDGAAGCQAGPTGPAFIDLIFIVDESGSMFGEHQFVGQIAQDLEAALVPLGVGDGTVGFNQYGLVGFGGSPFEIDGDHEVGHPHLVGGGLFGTAAELATATGTLTLSGAFEDGYDGIEEALTYPLRPLAEKIFILVTDEDRDIVDPAATFNSTLAGLQAADVTLNGIVSVILEDGQGTTAVAVDAFGNAYLADGAGGVIVTPGGTVLPRFGFFDNTIADYVDLVFATDGTVGDVEQLRLGGTTATSFSNALIQILLGQIGLGAIGAPGDWRSIELQSDSNDRNVVGTNEDEPAFTLGDDLNAIPDAAQFLGDLAKDEKSGDENLRLGFEVQGNISFDDPGDVDVYSFSAEAGTEVWFDIDRTAGALDTVLELVDVKGTVLARSVNNVSLQSFSVEARTLFKDQFVENDFGGGVPTDAFDLYTTNPRDAGMRVILPGAVSGQRNEYFIRVRSNTPNAADLDDPNRLHDGLTKGHYQLQIRLRQVDEFPGSTVRDSFLRFATNGIEAFGLPAHSPLSGESADAPGDTGDEGFGNSQPLGNLLAVDRNTINVGGVLASSTDVDWYNFEVNYDLIQAIGGFNAGLKSFATIFDLDYADGISRADTNIAVYDQAGTLVYLGTDSDILEDQPGPTEGADTDDLSRGTFGKRDPYIGGVHLPAGVVPAGSSQTYHVAVFSNAMLPAALDQLAVSGASTPLARLEPANLTERIVEDHLGFVGYNSGLDATVPVLPRDTLFNGTTAQALNSHVVPFQLRDVVLFATTGGDLFTVDPFTGVQETDVTGTGANLTNILGDIAMRSDGFLFGINTSIRSQPINDANTGNYIALDSGNGAETTNGDDGIATTGDIGSEFQALTFRQNSVGNFDAFATNHRNDFDPATITEVALWRLNPNTGAIIDENPNANGNQPFRPLPPGRTGDITGLAFASPGGGTLFGVDEGGNLFNMFSLNPIRLDVTGTGVGFTALTRGPQNVENGAFANMLFAGASNGRMYAFSFNGTLQTIFDTNGDGIADSSSVPLGTGTATGLAFSTLDYNLWHPTLQRRADAGHGINPAPDNSRNDLDEATFNIGGQSVNQAEGGVSFYFGLENPQDGAPNRTLIAQPDAINYSSTNAGLYDTYNLPGGAHGTLVTDAFSLEGYNPGDKPTLYFNYFLATEDANSNTDGMRDAFRVHLSTNGGLTWNEIATNNSVRDITTSELPAYHSLSADAASDPRQRIQELFENSNSWRQARVDLGDFAGLDNLSLRFDFSTAGDITEIGDPNLPGDSFGNFTNSERGQNNAFEGAYIDDIIIGFAERGDLATATGAQTGFTQVQQDPRPGAPSQILEGPYQLEIRRATEFAVNNNRINSDIFLFQTFDTNDRLTDAFTLLASPGASVVDGQAFALTDGVHTITFEFDNDGTVSPGLVVPIPFGGGQSAAQIGNQIAAAINSVNTLFPNLVPPFAARASSIPTSNKVEIINATETSPIGSGLNLTATAETGSISEAAGLGATTVTVNREGSTAVALNFTLFAIDPTTGGPTDEVTLNGTGSTTFFGMIPAGSSSVPVAVDAVDDALADGTQPVHFRAVAAGFQSVTDVLDVTDDEEPTLTVAITGPASIPEPVGPPIGFETDVLWVGNANLGFNDGTFAITQVNVGQFGAMNLDAFDVIYVDSNAGGLATLQSRAADIAAFVNAGGGLVTENGGQEGNPDYSWVPNAGAGLTWQDADRNLLEITDPVGTNHPITDSLSSTGLSNWNNSQHNNFPDVAGMDVLVNDVTDPLNPVANLLADEFGAGRLVYLGSDAAGHQGAGQAQDLIREALRWAGQQIIVGGPTTTATVSRNTLTNQPLEVSLQSMDPSEAVVPASVIIPAGSSSASFLIGSLDDNLLDGDQTVQIGAFAAGFHSGLASVAVLDIEAGELSASVDEDFIVESDGVGAATGTITRAGTTSVALAVTLSAIDPSTGLPTDEVILRSGAVSGPSIVVMMPAGVASVPFNIDTVDDGLVDGTQPVVVVPTAVGFASLVDVLDVHDDESAPLDPVTVGLNFTGSTLFDGPLLTPPDTMGAVGPNHIVELINNRYAVYNKATGALLFAQDDDAFWTATGVVLGGTAFDPRIIFDPASDRWFASAITGGAGNDILVAVSMSNDPTAGWTGFQFIADPSATRFNDFDTLGLDAEALYLTTSNFIGGLFADSSIFVLPKADLLAVVPTVANRTSFPVAGLFHLQPTVDFGPAEGVASFLAASAGGGTQLTRLDVLNPGGVPSLSPITAIPVPGYGIAPFGSQPGPDDDIETSTAFSSSIVEIGQSLWAAHAVLDPTSGNAAIRWYHIDETTSEVLGTGLISDPNLDFYYPSIAVNPFGDVVIGFSGSGNAQFISSYAAVGRTQGGVTSFDAPTLLQAGVDTYSLEANGRNRWGDYSATVVDPSDPFTFWTFQEFVVATDTWAIQISELSVPTERLDVTVTGPTGINEGAGPSASTARVTRITDNLGGALVVSLVSSDLTELGVPASVMIPPGVTSVSFPLDAIDDTFSDGNRVATIFATSPGFTSGSDTVEVFDDEPKLAVSDNVNVSASGQLHGEVSIAVDPTDPLNLVATAVQDPTVDTVNNILTAANDVVWFSDDGGLNWQASTPADLPGGADGGDPSVVFDRAGTVYFAHRDLNFGIVVYRSLDGGQTWGQGTIVPLNDPVNDPAALTSPYLAVGPDVSNPTQDRLYVGYHVGGVARINSSLDGLAWQAVDTVVSPTGSGTGAQISVGSDGELFYVWENFAAAGVTSVILNTSIDGGQNWAADQTIYTSNVNIFNDPFLAGVGLDGLDERAGDALGDYEIPAQPEWGISTRLSTDVDRSGFANDGTIYVALTDQGDLDGDPDDVNPSDHHDTDIFVTRSTDGGITWSTPVLVNDNVSVSSQFLPWLAVDQATGNVAVAWYDARDDNNNNEVAVYASVSLDGGASFQPSVRVAQELSGQTVIDPTQQVTTVDAFDFGDYLGLDFDDGRLHVAWADNGGLLGTGPTNQAVFYSTVALVAEDLTLTVDIAADAIPENGGFTTATITRSGGDISQPLVVAIAAIDPTTGQTTDELNVQATATILANQTSVVVNITAANDFIADGTQPVVITASAFPFDSISDSVDVLDDETPTLTVTVNPNSISENAGAQAAQGTVTRNTPTDEPLVVFLISSDTSEATVPQTVVIPAGAMSANFFISAVDELISDGTRLVTIFATAAGFASGQDSLNVSATNNLVSFERLGDKNLQRQQGHILIESNVIRDTAEFGINVDAAARTSAGNRPHAGPVINTPTLNNGRLVPGVTIENNLVTDFGTGGIRFSGDPNSGGPLAPVAFGLIVNNTVFGAEEDPVGTGIVIENNASPTTLNNIVSGVQFGITIDASSQNLPSPPIVGTMLYHNIPANQETNFGNLGSFAIVLPATAPLFVDPIRGNFYLVDGAAAIDSSLNALVDRSGFVTVKDPLGIPESPILAPDDDVFGQNRVDDPSQNPPPGMGSNIFKDRGAVERADFLGPRAVLVNPADDPTALTLVQTSPDLQQDPHVVVVNATFPVREFGIRLLDDGSGIDDTSVRLDRFTLDRDGMVLTEGTDYFFRYNPFRDLVELVSPDGAFGNGVYTIFLHADGDPSDRITDIGGTPLALPNPHQFTVIIDTVPPVATVVSPEDGGPDDADPSLDVVVVDAAQDQIVIRIEDPQGDLDHATIALAPTPNVPVFALELTQDLAPRGSAPIVPLVLDVDYTFAYTIDSSSQGTITLLPTPGGILAGSFTDALYTITLGDGMPGGLKDITDLAENILANTVLVVNVREVAVPVIETSGSTDVAEEGETSDTYSVVLASEPTDNVLITLSFDASQITTDVPSLMFTPANWQVPQIITVTAVDDVVPEPDPHTTSITHTATSADVLYDGIAVVSVTVNIAENDEPPLVTGQKYDDLDGDGIKDPGEPGVGGWTIFHDANTNGVLDAGEFSTVTAADGTYNLEVPTLGTVTIAEVLQPGWLQTAPAAGTHSIVITAAGQVFPGRDFGNFRVATISGRKFEDLNRDGVQNAGESGLAGWSIFLDDNANGLLDAGETSVVTNGSGDYQITNLGPGVYNVAEVIQAGWVQTSPIGSHTVVVNSSGALIAGIDFGNFQDLVFGPEFPVNSIQPGAQRFSSIAMAPDGSFVAAWTGPDGSDFGVFARRFDAAGQPLGPDFPVNTFTLGRQWLPSVAVDPNGRITVTWTSFNQDGTPRSIYARRFAADGTPQGGEFRVNTVNAGFQTNSTAAVDAAGTITIVWTSFANTTVAGDVFARRFDAGGGSLGDQFRVNTFTNAGQGDSAVASDPDGNTVVIWTSFTQDGSDGGVFGQRYDANGQPIGAEFQINEFAFGRQSEPVVTMDPGGGFAVSWTSIDQDGSGRGIFGRAYNALGEPRDGVFQANSFSPGDQRDSAIAADAHGGFTIVWASDAQDGSGSGVFAQRFSPLGDKVGGEFQVHATIAGNQDEPDVASDPDGNITVIWSGFDNSDRGILGRQISLVTAPTPEVTVFANGSKLVDDHPDPVDFGTGFVGFAGPTRTFTVRNDGTVPLALGAPSIPAGFALTEGLAANLNPGQTDTFTVELDTTAQGPKAGAISFTNGDADENPFDIQVTGQVDVAASEVTVLLGAVPINDDEVTPIDFGVVTQGQPGPTRVFTVRNDGTGPLSLSGLVAPPGFTVTEGLAAVLNPSDSDTFTVRLDSATLGNKSGDVSFTTNDADENPFNFAVTGVVDPAVVPVQGAEVTVMYEGVVGAASQSASVIADGSTTPIDFGAMTLGAVPKEHRFTVRNDGDADLTLAALKLPAGFVLVDGLPAKLSPGGSDAFTVRLDGGMPGAHSGMIAFDNNDLDENPFDFMVSGMVMADKAMPTLFRDGLWFYDLDGVGGAAEKVIGFGAPGDVPVTGDWNNDGIDEAAVFRNGIWFFDIDGAGGAAEKAFAFGAPGDIPVAGDFNGDGNTDVGVFRNGIWFLDLNGAGGAAEHAFAFGIGGDVPVTGDFNHDGRTDAAVFRSGIWFHDLDGVGGAAESAYAFGIGGDVPVVGDFNADGTSDAAVFRGGLWFADLDNQGGVAEKAMHYGIGTDVPLTARQGLGVIGAAASIASSSGTAPTQNVAAAGLDDDRADDSDDPVGAALDAILEGGAAQAGGGDDAAALATRQETLEVLAGDATDQQEDDARAELLGEVLDEAMLIGL